MTCLCKTRVAPLIRYADTGCTTNSSDLLVARSGWFRNENYNQTLQEEAAVLEKDSTEGQVTSLADFDHTAVARQHTPTES